MRIITLNINGIRSAERKGFFTWMQLQNADIICLQETKAQVTATSIYKDERFSDHAPLIMDYDL